MSESSPLLFLQGTRKMAETNRPSFIHKCGETGRAQAGLCARHLFSFQGWAPSPAGREMSCRDVIVGHSACREWAAEVHLCFSFSFLALGPWSPPWPDSERPESSSLEAGRDVGQPSPAQQPAPLLECAGHKGLARVCLGGGGVVAGCLCLGWFALVEGERVLVSMAVRFLWERRCRVLLIFRNHLGLPISVQREALGLRAAAARLLGL